MVGIKYADFLSWYVYIVEVIAFSCSCCLIKIIGRSFLEMSLFLFQTITYFYNHFAQKLSF